MAHLTAAPQIQRKRGRGRPAVCCTPQPACFHSSAKSDQCCPPRDTKESKALARAIQGFRGGWRTLPSIGPDDVLSMRIAQMESRFKASARATARRSRATLLCAGKRNTNCPNARARGSPRNHHNAPECEPFGSYLQTAARLPAETRTWSDNASAWPAAGQTAEFTSDDWLRLLLRPTGGWSRPALCLEVLGSRTTPLRSSPPCAEEAMSHMRVCTHDLLLRRRCSWQAQDCSGIRAIAGLPMRECLPLSVLWPGVQRGGTTRQWPAPGPSRLPPTPSRLQPCLADPRPFTGPELMQTELLSSGMM